MTNVLHSGLNVMWFMEAVQCMYAPLCVYVSVSVCEFMYCVFICASCDSSVYGCVSVMSVCLRDCKREWHIYGVCVCVCLWCVWCLAKSQ